MRASSAALVLMRAARRGGRGQVADGFEGTKLTSVDGATAATRSWHSSSSQVCQATAHTLVSFSRA